MSKKVIQTKIRSGNKKLTGDTIKTGPCVFPYNYKGEIYNECYKGKHGDWCATEVDKDTGKMKKYAFCDYKEKKTATKKKAVKKKSVKKKATKPPSKKKASTSTSTSPPKKKLSAKKERKKYTFKQRDPLQGVEEKYIIKPEDHVVPRLWELPNRKTFPNWMYTSYKPYLAVKNSMKTAEKNEKFNFFKHQKLVRDYLQNASPFRGLLLYHGLGVGKTCASIGIAEGFRTDRKIVILLNKSLKKNFRVNLLKCGFDYFRTNQHWVFKPLTTEDNLYYYMRYLGLTRQFIQKHGGCMIVDFSKKSNYDNLTAEHRELLHIQVDVMIDQKYEFIHIDGLNKRKLEKMVKDKVLDNKLLIIDEVHNLTNAMAKSKPGHRAKYLRQLIMEAENLKCVFLSGTPMINRLIEAGQLFNLLRGYITQYVFRLTPKGSDARKISSLEVVLNSLMATRVVDQNILDKKEKLISITKVPHNFVNIEDEGLVNDPSNNLSEVEFIALMQQTITNHGYSSTVITEKHTAFPEDETKFLSLFFDSVRNKIKNPMLFQSRILGLTSYFKTNDRSLLPEVTKNEVIKVPMSKYQFINYSQSRKN